ncbi:MAG: Gfo/Idh/MocA family protein [Pirellulaceae bacterium]
MSSNISRRRFVQATAAAGLVVPASSAMPAVITRGRLEKPTLLGIGAGGRGKADLQEMRDAGFDVIALADIVDAKKLTAIEDKRLQKNVDVREMFPQATFGTDYRQMIADLGDKIDAVLVSTPDHHHFHASVQAMLAGKHVYCQKPLTHGIWEARKMTEVATQTKVKTQMGNQGHAQDHLRRCVELIQAGVIGPVKAIHAWTNRPIWPQGFAKAPTAMRVPKGIDWEQWIGPAPRVEYSSEIAPFSWRGWWDYGTGALGDMACHIMDVGFWGMAATSPVRVKAEQNGGTELSPPINSRIQWDFAANQFSSADGFSIHWYDGYLDAHFQRDTWSLEKKSPEYNHPGEDVLEGMEFEKYGSVIVGEHGKLFFDRHDDRWVLKVDGGIDGFDWPAERIPRAAGQNAYKEWYQAVVGEVETAQSNFSYAGPFTETVLLGVLAQRVPGEELRWNSDKLEVVGRPELSRLVKRDYRAGWSEVELLRS